MDTRIAYEDFSMVSVRGRPTVGSEKESNCGSIIYQFDKLLKILQESPEKAQWNAFLHRHIDFQLLFRVIKEEN